MGGKWHLSREQSHLIAGHLRGTCLGRAGRHPHLILGSAAGRALVSHSKLGQSPNQPQPRAPQRTGWGFTMTSLQLSTLFCPALPPPLQVWLCQPHQVEQPCPPLCPGLASQVARLWLCLLPWRKGWGRDEERLPDSTNWVQSPGEWNCQVPPCGGVPALKDGSLHLNLAEPQYS